MSEKFVNTTKFPSAIPSGCDGQNGYRAPKMRSCCRRSLVLLWYAMWTAGRLGKITAFLPNMGRTHLHQHHADITTVPPSVSPSSTALAMSKYRGLEQRREGATPTEGGMTLYIKAGPDGTSVGDCPFAHFVRMVLAVKKLEYDLQPSVQETKPKWLIEYYDGKMPALRHRRECYVESDTIASYLDFFFPEPSLRGATQADEKAVEEAAEGLFPAMAQYLKYTPDGDDTDAEKKEALKQVFQRMNEFLTKEGRTGPYLVGNGEKITLLDCRLTPVFYHATTGIQAFKDGAIDMEKEFPALYQYTQHMFQTEAFRQTVYPTDVVTWGWGNARSK